MADKAYGSVSASIFFDELKSSMSGNLDWDPKDTTEKWIYTEHQVTTTGTVDMITTAEEYLGTAVESAAGDKIKWIAIKHTGTSDGSSATSKAILITHNAQTPAHGGATTTAGILIEPNELFVAKLPQTTIADLHAIVVTVDSSTGALSVGTGEVKVRIAAILDDV